MKRGVGSFILFGNGKYPDFLIKQNSAYYWRKPLQDSLSISAMLYLWCDIGCCNIGGPNSSPYGVKNQEN